HRFSKQICLSHQPLLDHGYLLDRDFHTQVAASYHDAIGRIKNRTHVIKGPRTLDFRYDERIMTKSSRGTPHCGNVLGALDKRLTDRIHPLFQGKFQASMVILGESPNPEIDTGQV